MAENKKSFTAYCDWKETFDSLPDDKAGQLIKHLFAYVNDENPQTDDILINAVFAQIKQTLKRDLKKWESKKNERSRSAILGNLKRYQIDLYNDVVSKKITLEEAKNLAKTRVSKHSNAKSRIATHSDAKLAVRDSVSVSVRDSVIVSSKDDVVLNNTNNKKSFDPDGILSVEEIKKEYLSNSKVLESLVNEPKNKLNNTTELKNFLDQFCDDLTQEGRNIISRKEFGKYFLNCLRKGKFKLEAKKSKNISKENFISNPYNDF